MSIRHERNCQALEDSLINKYRTHSAQRDNELSAIKEAADEFSFKMEELLGEQNSHSRKLSKASFDTQSPKSQTLVERRAYDRLPVEEHEDVHDSDRHDEGERHGQHDADPDLTPFLAAVRRPRRRDHQL